jgi:hypothetical protein
MRQLFRCLEGAAIKMRRERHLAMWHAWNAANLGNAEKLPDLGQLLRKLEPIENRVMSPKAQRRAILGLAEALGAEVVYLKKGETLQ